MMTRISTIQSQSSVNARNMDSEFVSNHDDRHYTELIRTVISPHQDVFSRFISGSGAPYWALEAVGLNPRRIHQTGAGIIHSAWETQGLGGEEGIKSAKEGKAGEWPDSELLATKSAFTYIADYSDLEYKHRSTCFSTLRDYVLGWGCLCAQVYT
jgi:hypothetical protein